MKPPSEVFTMPLPSGKLEGSTTFQSTSGATPAQRSPAEMRQSELQARTRADRQRKNETGPMETSERPRPTVSKSLPSRSASRSDSQVLLAIQKPPRRDRPNSVMERYFLRRSRLKRDRSARRILQVGPDS